MWPRWLASRVIPPPLSTAANCWWSPVISTLALARSASAAISARWVIEMVLPSSMTIRVRSASRSPGSLIWCRNRVEFHALPIPASASTLRAACEAVTPITCPPLASHARAASHCDWR